MSFLDRIREANTHDFRGFLPFRVSGVRVGFVKRGFAEILTRWPEVFRVEEVGVTLATALDDPAIPVEARSAAVHDVLLQLRDEGLINGWRNEIYPVNGSYGDVPRLLMERAAIPYFGVCAYGVHMNGYVRNKDGMRMWVGRRALDKPTSPGKLDQLVAGGQPAGIGLKANLIKECWEEAGIPPAIAEQAVPVGAVTYCLETAQGLRPDVMFNFDLELPEDFTPTNTDGEMETFYLWPMEKVIETVNGTDAFKFNCALVVIDFLIRHGFIPPEQPDYIEMLGGLHYRERAFVEVGVE